MSVRFGGYVCPLVVAGLFRFFLQFSATYSRKLCEKFSQYGENAPFLTMLIDKKRVFM